MAVKFGVGEPRPRRNTAQSRPRMGLEERRVRALERMAVAQEEIADALNTLAMRNPNWRPKR